METTQRLEGGLAIGGQQLAMMVMNLAEKTPCVPTLWAFDGTAVKISYLAAANSDRAEEMARGLVAGEFAQHHSVSSVIDVFITDPRTGVQTDALQLRVVIPGTSIELVFALPYDSAGPTFTRGFELLARQGVPEELDAERLRAALFTNIEKAAAAEPASVLVGLPRTLSTELLAFTTPAGAKSAPAAGQSAPAPDALLRLASLAPFAGFLLVAAADGKLETSELDAFKKALNDGTDALLGQMLAASPVDPLRAVKLLSGDPPLTVRAIAAAGELMRRDPAAGPAARAAFLAIVRAVAARGGATIGAPEQAALDAIGRHLDAGIDATAGADPFAGLGEDGLSRLMVEASLALFAGFVVVAAADGKVDKSEISTFLESLPTVRHPLLSRMLAAGDIPIEGRIAVLLTDTERVRSSLRSAGLLFARHPQGDAGRAEFMQILKKVAAADGVVTAEEQQTLDRVAELLDGKTWTKALRVRFAVFGGLVLAALVAVWQLASVGLGLPEAAFVPVACALELLVLLPVLALSALTGARYLQQVGIGTLTGVIASVPIALTSMLVTGVLFPSALAASGGTVFDGAIAGLIGTAVTGFALSLLLGVVLRSRA